MKTDKLSLDIAVLLLKKVKEQELGHYDYIYAMNLDFDQKSTELRQGKFNLISSLKG